MLSPVDAKLTRNLYIYDSKAIKEIVHKEGDKGNFAETALGENR